MKEMKMLGYILVFWVYSTVQSAADQPQIQVLSDSSETGIEWPPSGVSWSDSPSKWPGHLKQLGSMHPRIKVPSAYKKEFPGAADFYKNFVEPRLPVIFENAAGGLEADQLKLSNLNNSGLAALSFIEVSRFVEEEKDRRSLREFSKHIHEEIYLQDNVNNDIKKFITLPRCLRCSYLTPHLVETRHVVIGRSFPLPLLQDENDLLTCLLDGKKEVILADPREYPEITRFLDLDQSSGEKGSYINSLRVDYLKYPEAAKVGKYHIALLGPGDCLYIPAAWIQQTNIIETVNTIELRWENTAWKPDDECLKSIHKHAPLSQFSYKAEHYIGVEPSVDQVGKSLKKTTKILDWILESNLSEEELFRKLSRSSEIIPDLKKWNSECSTRGREMFQLLDTNQDDVLSFEDVERIDESQANRLIGYMEDRLADLLDIAADQKLDGLGDTSHHRKEKLEEDIRRNLKEEL